MFSRNGFAALHRHFWQPPRAHGEVNEGRQVSFLELFYDLVYVVVIAQAAHHLAGHVTWIGFGEFAVIFGLIWFAWMNGTYYHDLHGRGDARTRFYVFAQMGVLILLAVFTDKATSVDGQAFALVYSAYLFLLGWLWYTVRRQDDPAFHRVTTPYLVGILGSAVIAAVSAFLPDGPRVIVWAILVVFWITGTIFLERETGDDAALQLGASESLVERFGLFTIIVLGEVIVGIVNGIVSTDRVPVTIATGMVGLGIGFAFWWTYFDIVGGREVAADRGAMPRWLVGHFVVAMSIAATGGVMVAMIGQASSAQHSALTAMLLSVSVAIGLLALILIASSLADWRELAHVYRPVSVALAASAAVSVFIGWLAPQPWVHMLLLTLVLGAVWFFGLTRWFFFTHPEAESEQGARRASET